MIQEMGWKENNYDYTLIAKNLYLKYDKETIKELRKFVGLKVKELQDEVKDYETRHGTMEIYSDDGFSDVCYHVVGLGEKEYLKVMNNPRLLETRYNGKGHYGYKESFAYCFHTLSYQVPVKEEVKKKEENKAELCRESILNDLKIALWTDFQYLHKAQTIVNYSFDKFFPNN